MHMNFPILTTVLLYLEVISAGIALSYLKKINNTYWKWFILYLVIVSLSDFFISDIVSYLKIEKQYFYAYAIIPIQFIFFYWLYALKSLKSKGLFLSFIGIYILSFIPIELYFEKLRVVYSFNYTIGTFLLMILVFLEFKKQIQNDDILEYKKNKMFYINIGTMMFYVGTLPFFGLYNLIIKEPFIWNIYYLYFLISNCLMYLLFIASFIWGKVK
jgi:hypothetical protein